jgi:hypothetical protein
LNAAALTLAVCAPSIPLHTYAGAKVVVNDIDRSAAAKVATMLVASGVRPFGECSEGCCCFLAAPLSHPHHNLNLNFIASQQHVRTFPETIHQYALLTSDRVGEINFGAVLFSYLPIPTVGNHRCAMFWPTLKTGEAVATQLLA